MSDGFDKEAEREKLREKFADDDQKREHTQRMSELLLKGATMTNRHCDDCGDPIFRQDGQEFCPTCHTIDAKDAREVTRATQGGPDEQHTNAPDSAATNVEDQTATTTNPKEATMDRNFSPSNPEAPETRASAPSSASDRRSAAESGGVADARESLTRTLTRFARAAEQTDDPRRARDHLQAAREAAEALAALD